MPRNRRMDTTDWVMAALCAALYTGVGYLAGIWAQLTWPRLVLADTAGAALGLLVGIALAAVLWALQRDQAPG